MSDQTCLSRVKDEYESRMDDLRQLWDSYCNDPDESVNDLGTLYEYGLSFDYVAPQTFKDQNQGYFRYQLSWGGPSDEFRIYAEKINDYSFSVYKIEYWFLDWFDGAHVLLQGKEYKFIKELFESFFVESGSAGIVHSQALEDYEPDYDNLEDEQE